jgi:hypothetical protein
MNGAGGVRRGAVAVVAVDMGYGHLRAAHALAGHLGVPVEELDRPPLASPEETAYWQRARRAYELISRASQLPLVGRAARATLDALTAIPHLHPRRDLSAPDTAVRTLERLRQGGFGDAMVSRLQRDQATLLTTFYAPAVLADLAGWRRVVCVVTDSDIHRVWVGPDGWRSAIHYCVPSMRALRRLRAYGVPGERIHFTGFPLPDELVGGEGMAPVHRNLARRLVRLDPRGVFREQLSEPVARMLGPLPAEEQGRPPLLVFAVGGAGAQAGLAGEFLPSLAEPLRAGRLRLALVAGVRAEVAAAFERAVRRCGLGEELGRAVTVVLEQSVVAYLARFTALLAEADVLWTKPSEVSFFAALGVPLVLGHPVGAHERYNRRWVLHHGAGLKQESARHAWGWLREWLEDGTLAAAAWAGYTLLPKHGTYRIADVVSSLSR